MTNVKKYKKKKTEKRKKKGQNFLAKYNLAEPVDRYIEIALCNLDRRPGVGLQRSNPSSKGQPLDPGRLGIVGGRPPRMWG